MANVLVEEKTMQSIGNAIREKTGKSDLMLPSEMADEIKSVQSGGATEPYIEETYNKYGHLTGAKMVGQPDIRGHLFWGCSYLETLSVPDNITEIGNEAFNNCSKLALTSLPDSITSIGSRTFMNCNKLALTSLPSSLESIGSYAFYYCSNIAIESLPDSLTGEIYSETFYKCSKITKLRIPKGVTGVNTQAFGQCTGLETVTFEGTPEWMSSDAFKGCTNLTTINAPWSEGAVSGAPWGATNATINYYIAG